ncbi:MAG: site-specific DNA-methyltransferase [Oribacterium sp.]|jgi:site-specific DNA-methyltransferase (adenine-specific)|nr:site-specific DNA-methyltransferase [Oribacterium sp.]MDY6316047.1 site-specific DNA-methyltransferase [Oribacterium sp.]
MPEKKAPKNKTIDITVEEGRSYLERCICFNLQRMRDEAPRDLHESKRDDPLSSNLQLNLEISSPSKIDIAMLQDRLICGDSFSVLPKLPEHFVDLLIADPPYNMDKEFHGGKFKKTSDEAYAEYTEKWVVQAKRLMKRNASIYVCCDWVSSGVIERVLRKYFMIQNRITWQREKGRGALRNWKNGMEDIWFATNSSKYTFNIDAVKQRRKVIAPYRVDGKPKDWQETEQGNFRDTYPSNFWDDISVPYWSMPENTAHPTQKPEKLLAKLILASSNAGDMVFDPFAGSGSTLVTAKKLGRHFSGIERDEQYCVWAEKRLEMAETDQTIQGYADAVFWERNTAELQEKARKRE